MSTIKTTYLQHPSSASANLTLAADGSVSGGAGLGGLVHIATESFSGVSSVSLDNVFSSTYDNYRVIIVASSSLAGSIFNMRLRVSASDATTNYVGSLIRFQPSTTSYDPAVTDRLKIGVVRSNDTAICDLLLCGPNTATKTRMTGTHVDNNQAGVTGGAQADATSFDGFTIYPDSGTITGTLRVYGYRNS